MIIKDAFLRFMINIKNGFRANGNRGKESIPKRYARTSLHRILHLDFDF